MTRALEQGRQHVFHVLRHDFGARLAGLDTLDLNRSVVKVDHVPHHEVVARIRLEELAHDGELLGIRRI